jgi:hypothetical protein
MTLIDISSSSSETTASDPTTTIIIFECNDFRRDNTGLILLKRTKSNNEKFELHLHDDYTKNQAIAMILDIKDLARMFESLEEYFNQSPNRGI